MKFAMAGMSALPSPPGCSRRDYLCYFSAGVHQIDEARWRKLNQTPALTPALSPRRGRTVRHLPEKSRDRVCRVITRRIKDMRLLSLFPGEKVRMRASANANIIEAFRELKNV